MSDNKKMALKARGLSQQNPFNTPDKVTWSPERILDKPGHIIMSEQKVDLKPLAGKFTGIG
jgi:hypothetical protein